MLDTIVPGGFVRVKIDADVLNVIVKTTLTYNAFAVKGRTKSGMVAYAHTLENFTGQRCIVEMVKKVLKIS